jgi:PAS domain S-box-containing protein
MPAMAFVSEADGSRVFVNRRWIEYTGLTAEEALGAGWQGVIHPDDLDRVLEEWRTGTAKGQPLDYECRMRRADGEYRWFHVRAVSLRDRHGNVTKWYAVATDIEDRKRAEEDRQRLRQLEMDLAHINRLNIMGELTASIAHEVNQPLSGVVSNGSACLRWLAGDAPDLEEARQAARHIVRDGKRAGEVIAHIRALTKRVGSPREKLDVNEMIREVIVIVADEAKRNSVTIHRQFADDLSPVAGDRVELQQVVLNLILNAIEAMSSVSERARDLTITTRNLDPDQIQVTVEDSGKGIDPQSMSRIFDSFYTTKASGMGMGLSICRSIIRTHDGQLWATSRNGQGATFLFTLPRYGDKAVSAAETGV